ncbi:MAG: hypothetical protein ACREPT_02890, partial [Rudaea sp.]
MRTLILATSILLAFAQSARADEVVERAMHDELTRSLAQLKLDGNPRPYFIAYQVEQLEQIEVEASLGAIGFSGQRGLRVGRVDVRVGDAQLDSSRIAGRQPIGVELPVEDDYGALRR